MKILSSKKSRILIQTAFLIFVTIVSVLHLKFGGGPSGVASIHAICPFGGLESLHSFFLKGEFIKKTYYSNLVLFGGTTFIVIFLGRIFCGWICALGTLQDIFGKIGYKFLKKRHSVPEFMDRPLRKLKYIIFIGILYLTWKTGTLVINSLDPFAAYSHISAGTEDLLGEYLIGFIILVAMLLASLFYDRLFCRYLCPLGAYYAFLNKFSKFKIIRKDDICIQCGKCDRICPAEIQISKESSVAKTECFSCMECVNICPTKEKSLEPILIGKSLNFRSIGGLGVGVFLFIVLLTKLTGIYSTTPDSIKSVLNGDPANIRGWMSIKEISEGFGIPEAKLYEALGISPEQLPDNITIKESEEHLKKMEINFNHDQIGIVVAEILGKAERKNSEDQVKVFTFRGHMTISEISSETGFSENEVIEKLELPQDIPVNRPLKDMTSEYGYEMGELKSKAEKHFIK